ncbi:hypothetical protein NL676_026300 [Syzygium grande]|nr:hypothetical protein NL676_026300 [Syzygium grande]
MVIHELLLKVVVLGALLVPHHNHIAEADDLMTKPGCQSSCGHLVIPYPFGSSDSSSNCHFDHPSFIVYCDNSTEPPVPYMGRRSSNLQIRDISIEGHEMQLTVWIGQECYNTSGYDRSSSNYPWIILSEFPLSSTKNKFTTIGCNTLAAFETAVGSSLSGRFGRQQWVVYRYRLLYGFVAEIGSYNFSTGDLKQLNFKDPPLVLDWAIGNQTCQEAKKNSTSYMCTNAENGSSVRESAIILRGVIHVHAQRVIMVMARRAVEMDEDGLLIHHI